MNLPFNRRTGRLTALIVWMAVMAASLRSCVDPYPAEVIASPTKLIVDGLITDDAGPYTVTLALSEPYDNNRGTLAVNSAQVWVQDDNGQRFDFLPRGAGNYQSDSLGFRAQAGKIYTLFVRTSDGKIYQSKPELLRAAPPIDTVYNVFFTTTNSLGVAVSGFEVYLETEDPDTSGNFYRWRWAHYDTVVNCLQKLDGETRVMFLTRCCGPCWTVRRCYGCINILSDIFLNGNTIRRYLADIPYDSKEDYFLTVEQLALPREAYQFWNLVDGQINNSGGIFDKPPASIQGNISNTADPEEQVLGYFTVAGLARKSVYLKRDNIAQLPPANNNTNLITSQVPGCVSCNESLTRTARRPPGW